MNRSTRVAVAAFGAVTGIGVLAGSAVAGTNAFPTCNNAIHNLTQGGPPLASSVAPLCSDEDEDTLTYGVGVNNVANGTLVFDATTGAFTYTPDAGFVGTDDFTFFAEDGFVVPSAVDDDEITAADASFPALITINVAAQVTTTTTSTSTTVAVAPSTATSVLARTGVDNTTTAGSGLLVIGAGLALVAASGALVTRVRKT